MANKSAPDGEFAFTEGSSDDSDCHSSGKYPCLRRPVSRCNLSILPLLLRQGLVIAGRRGYDCRYSYILITELTSDEDSVSGQRSRSADGKWQHMPVSAGGLASSRNTFHSRAAAVGQFYELHSGE